ncbi:MAG: hypothetical protein ABI833_18000 [Acidobacteriota bacterium]
MEFRLIYQGALPAEQRGINSGPEGRAKDKHRLRKLFHPQLRELWKQHPDLREQASSKFVKMTTPPNLVSHPGPNVTEIVQATGTLADHPDAKTWLEHIAGDHVRCGGKFVPLISHRGGFTCALNILFLRRDNPSNLISNGGDIDNRIKVLFDGLRMPKTVSELGGYAMEQDEDPFFACSKTINSSPASR